MPSGVLEVFKAMEIGHIFKLGTKYSESMGANVLTADGKSVPIIMGSYGIGVERIITAAIEQNNDGDGIIWPKSITPFDVIVTITNIKDERLREAGEKLYSDLRHAGLDVLLDDRDERAGVKFKDADLIGIPYRITVGKKVSDGMVELFDRKRNKTSTSNWTMSFHAYSSWLYRQRGSGGVWQVARASPVNHAQDACRIQTCCDGPVLLVQPSERQRFRSPCQYRRSAVCLHNHSLPGHRTLGLCHSSNGRRKRIRETVLATRADLIGNKRWFPVRYASQPRFDLFFKILPWEAAGIIVVAPGSVLFLGETFGGNTIISQFAPTNSQLNWLGKCPWPNGAVSWLRLDTTNRNITSVQETGIFIFGSHASTRRSMTRRISASGLPLRKHLSALYRQPMEANRVSFSKTLVVILFCACFGAVCSPRMLAQDELPISCAH